MDSPRLILNDRSYDFPDLQKGNFGKLENQFETSALHFCRDWLNGRERFVLHTSGSTGAPKEISATRHQLIASAKGTIDALHLRAGLTSLVCLDTRYVAGIMMLVRAMEAGMTMIVVEASSNPFEKLPETLPVDFTAMVPLQVDTLINHPDQLDRIGKLIIGGAPLHPTAIQRLQQTRCECYATYGMTETLSHIALQRLNGSLKQDFFQVLPGITIHTDERSCLVINAPHLNAHPVITNDLVELISSTQFRWLGRMDTVINSGGVKVLPEKVDEAVASVFEKLGLSNRHFITSLPDNTLGQAVTLVIEGALSEQTQQKIAEFLGTLLPRFERPRSIKLVSNFIQTSTGKIDKLKTTALL